MTRKVYVPEDDGLVRYLEVLDNPDSVSTTAVVTVLSYLSSSTDTVVLSSSSGDLVLSTMDDWLATDDTTESTEPALAFAFSGGAAAVQPTGPVGRVTTYRIATNCRLRCRASSLYAVGNWSPRSSTARPHGAP